MSKFEVSKLVEAAKLNKRTGIPLVGPPTSIPYGAIIFDVEEDGDYYKFSYAADRFQVRRDVAAGAFHAVQGVVPSASVAAPTPPLPAPAAEPAPAPSSDDRPVLDFQSLRVKGAVALSRARIPGGWLVSTAYAVTFVPDPRHEWDGGSLT